MGHQYVVARSEAGSTLGDWLMKHIEVLPLRPGAASQPLPLNDMDILAEGPGLGPVTLRHQPADLLETVVFQRYGFSAQIVVRAPDGIALAYRPSKRRLVDTQITQDLPSGDQLGKEHALNKVMRRDPGAPVEELVPQVLHLIRKAEKWNVHFKQEGAREEVRIYMGEPLVATVECLTTTGSPAELKGDMKVEVHVVVTMGDQSTSRIALGQLPLPYAKAETPGGGHERIQRWVDVSVLFLPQEQPRKGSKVEYQIEIAPLADYGQPSQESEGPPESPPRRVKAGLSTPFTFEPERCLNPGDESLGYEIDAELIGKWHEVSAHQKVPTYSNGQALERRHPKCQGGEADVYSYFGHIVIRQLNKRWWAMRSGRPTAKDNKLREFLKDITIWNHLTKRNGALVAELKGWYLDFVEKDRWSLVTVASPAGLVAAEHRPRAGMRLAEYGSSLDEELGKQHTLRRRFEYALAVLHTMKSLHESFPYLVFPDVKPANLLLSGGSSSTGSVSFVLCDLASVRRGEDSQVAIFTSPYAHKTVNAGIASNHVQERFATLTTVLQVLLGLKSEKLVPGASHNSRQLWTPDARDAIQLLLKDDILQKCAEYDEMPTNLEAFFNPLLCDELSPDAIATYVKMEHDLNAALDLLSEAEGRHQGPYSSASGVTGDKLVDQERWRICITSWIREVRKGANGGGGFKSFWDGFGSCRKDLLIQLGYKLTDDTSTGGLLGLVGSTGYDNHREEMLEHARHITEALIINLLRRRANSPVMPLRDGLLKKYERELEQMRIKFGHVRDKGWFNPALSMLREDVQRVEAYIQAHGPPVPPQPEAWVCVGQRPGYPPPWLKPSLFQRPRVLRFLDTLQALHKAANLAAHRADPNKQALESATSMQAIENDLLKPLEKVFKKFREGNKDYESLLV